MAFQVQTIWAYLTVDEDGNEGICGFFEPKKRQWIAMVGADQARVESLRPLAQQLAEHTGMTIRLARFSVRSDIEEIN